jgi:hypothetical protein
MIELLIALSMAGVQLESQFCHLENLQGWYKDDKIVLCREVRDLNLTLKHEAIHFIQERCGCTLLTDEELTIETHKTLDDGEVLFVISTYDDVHAELEARVLSQLNPEEIVNLIENYT